MTVTLLERKLDDVFIEVPRAEYGTTSGTIKNTTGATVTLTKQDLIGRPVKWVTDHWELAIPGTDEATVDGLVYDPQDDLSLANNATTTNKFVILVRGPALVDLNQIKSGFTLTTLATALQGLNPPIIRFTNASKTQDANY